MSHLPFVVFNGRKYDLSSQWPAVGDPVPDFQLMLFNKGDSAGIMITKDDLIHHRRPLLLSVTTSLDTPIGSLQTKKFDQMLQPYAKDALLWSVSSDLPFNINRFFEEENITSLAGGSDFLYKSFGKNFGVMVEEYQLLVRAVFVVDRNGLIRYSEVPAVVKTEINYEMAMRVLHEVIHEDHLSDADLQPSDEEENAQVDD
jgi:thiol peroxidase